ncbi:hypothetical protein GGF42_002522 [Coemansia sp. RSA 2424]|nr:hypothetical protein GGF42_002522 [Coemansia sp. RSA 2424]
MTQGSHNQDNPTPAEIRLAMEIFRMTAPTFSGANDELSSKQWTTEIRELLDSVLTGAPEYVRFALVQGKLVGLAKDAVDPPESIETEDLLKAVEDMYLARYHEDKLIEQLEQGTAFAKATRNTLVPRARKILKEVGGTERGREALAMAMERVSPEFWPTVRVDPECATYEQVEEGLTHFEQILRASTLAKLNFGESEERTAKEDGDDSQSKPSRSARRRARTRAMLKEYKQFKAERG